MHNISKNTLQKLVTDIANTMENATSTEILEKVRELYEQSIILHYQSEQEENTETIATSTTSDNVTAFLTDDTISESPEEISVTETNPITDNQEDDKELSIHERIKQIMDNAPKFDVDKKVTETKFDTTKTERDIEQKADEILISATPKPDVVENPTKIQTEETEITTPKVNLDEEFKDAIAADYAADLFEKAEKIELTKKSLNDRLSQTQIQIGLNDRIAFVKHLFNGSQVDFNRVLSQLNSFQNINQANEFLNNMVKPDYDWSEKTEYEERFLALIERKFL